MKRMLVNANDAEEVRIAIVEDGVLQELHVELSNRESYLGNLYKGKVVNIEPSIGAAFVNFGGTRNGFLHASDVVPAYADPEVDLVDILEGRLRGDADEGPDALRQLIDEDDDAGDEDEDEAGADDGDEDALRDETEEPDMDLDEEDADDDEPEEAEDDEDAADDDEDGGDDEDDDEDADDSDDGDEGEDLDGVDTDDDDDADAEGREPIARMAAQPEPEKGEAGDAGRKRRRRRRRRSGTGSGGAGTEVVGEVETEGQARAVEGPPPV
ncbi:MAG: hypothetical protein R3F30_16600, partial [Planctomycetota bacterium]